MPEYEKPFDVNKLPDQNFRAPDVIGTVEGWRAWRVSREVPRFGVGPRLYSVTHSDYYWTPKKASMAECNKCGEDLPRDSCSCGFYSAKTLKDLLRMSYPGYTIEAGQVTILGQVANWGKVVEAPSGWRSQNAYPVKLYVPYECWRLAEPIAEAYGVPVELGQWLAASLDKKLTKGLRDRRSSTP